MTSLQPLGPNVRAFISSSQLRKLAPRGVVTCQGHTSSKRQGPDSGQESRFLSRAEEANITGAQQPLRALLYGQLAPP